jgi:hypothetical protein
MSIDMSERLDWIGNKRAKLAQASKNENIAYGLTKFFF